jgi:hypothetical protein
MSGTSIRDSNFAQIKSPHDEGLAGPSWIMPLLFSSVRPNVSSWPSQSSYALLLTKALSGLMPFCRVCLGCSEARQLHY